MRKDIGRPAAAGAGNSGARAGAYQQAVIGMTPDERERLILENLPLTPNRKLDRAALRAASAISHNPNSQDVPQSPVEQKTTSFPSTVPVTLDSIPIPTRF